MSKRMLIVLLCLLCGLLLAGRALAMRSDHYWLDWFTPLTGGGGGPAGSTHYAVNFTVGQSVIGSFSGANYRGCLGFWCGGAAQYRVYLPLVVRNY